MSGKFKKIATGLLLLLLVLQVFSIDKSQEPIDPNLDLFQTENVPDDIRNLLKNACTDCHSQEVVFPWYTNVEPISWWVKGHIDHGRENLNFSKWQNYESNRMQRKIDECIEVLENKRMPLTSYALAHPKARLKAEDRSRLITFFESLR